MFCLVLFFPSLIGLFWWLLLLLERLNTPVGLLLLFGSPLSSRYSSFRHAHDLHLFTFHFSKAHMFLFCNRIQVI